jgi:hypothetical protein
MGSLREEEGTEPVEKWRILVNEEALVSRMGVEGEKQPTWTESTYTVQESSLQVC